jgi:hypothetical protein
MQQTPAGGGGNQFVTIAQNASVTDAAFVTLTGLFSFGADMSGLLLYVEATSATASYYLDNFSITLLAPPPGPRPRAILKRGQPKDGGRGPATKFSQSRTPIKTAAISAF